MINRRLKSTVLDRLRQFPAVALLGPRQVGKTTLARQVSEELAAAMPRGDGAPKRSIYLDLEADADRARLTNAAQYLTTHQADLVILDEVQRLPGLFMTLRGLIDEGRRRGRAAGQFLLLGSASQDLLQQSSESLAGRIAYHELRPIDALEVEAGAVETLWSRGGFAESLLAASDRESFLWRENFISTYLRRDIPDLGPRIPAETLRRFLMMLAHAQGGILNAAAFARSLAIEGKSIVRYIDLFADLFLVRRLQPYHANVRKRLVKSPKVYIRDSGLTHALLGIGDWDALQGHPVAGASWESFVIENLIAASAGAATPFFYRTSSGAEIDLLLMLPGGDLWAIDIKRAQSPSSERGFFEACEDVRPARAFIVHSGADRYPMRHGVEAISLRAMCGEVAARAS
jgi:hypothetical protein